MVARLHESGAAHSTFVDWLLRPFSKVRPGEGWLALLMLLCAFLILTSYYLMKTVREGMILSRGAMGLSGQELKAYAGGAMALLLVVMVPVYDALAARFDRLRLINLSYVVVIGCLAGFFVLSGLGVPIGLAFFIWIGLVGVFLVAQFWSYANDVYSEEQGKRLFAIIAMGGSLGAVLGPGLARLGSTYALIPLAAGLLLASLVLFNVIEHVHRRSAPAHAHAHAPIGGAGGFALVLGDRYLLLIAALVLVGTLVNSTGEYVLSNIAAEHAAAVVPATAHPELAAAARRAAITAERRELIKTFYSDFFFWVNLTGFAIQAFVVSRAIKVLGIQALFVMPVIALGVYGAIGAAGGLALVRAAKIAENGTDYSLENTVRQLLFLPTDRAVKYKAKAAIDTFVVRSGDTLSALLVWAGIHLIGVRGRGFAFVNLVLVAVWIAIAAGIVHRHRTSGLAR